MRDPHAQAVSAPLPERRETDPAPSAGVGRRQRTHERAPVYVEQKPAARPRTGPSSCLPLRPADLLLLDEPTNDLDVATLEMLEESLADFPGALVLVRHDRSLLDRVATSILSVEGDGRVVAHADLASWQTGRQGARRDAARDAAVREGRADSRSRAEAKGLKRLAFKEREEWARMEEAILAAEARAEACRTAAADPASRPTR